MRVLFLDIDGVLNNPGTYGGDNGVYRRDRDTMDPDERAALLQVPIAPECMARLNQIIARTGAVIVISSSWRLFARWEDLGPALVRYGLVGQVIGETPDLVNDPVWLEAWRTREGAPFEYERLERGMEIAEWLKARADVDSYAILDDCSDMAHLKSNLVLCDPVIGLDDPDVERAVWMLQQPSTWQNLDG
jgi:HAD domain in Swiss Army Knife RNA repair proteins